MKVRNSNTSLEQNVHDNKSRADLELQEISRDWTPEKWERYLKKFEGALKEELLPVRHYDRIAEESEVSIFQDAQVPASPAIIERVRLALEDLTERQRQVVELIFLQAKSERETAQELGIDRSSVRKHKRKGLKNLRKIILVGAPTLPLSRGSKNKNGGMK